MVKSATFLGALTWKAIFHRYLTEMSINRCTCMLMYPLLYLELEQGICMIEASLTSAMYMYVCTTELSSIGYGYIIVSRLRECNYSLHYTVTLST